MIYASGSVKEKAGKEREGGREGGREAEGEGGGRGTEER